MRQDLNKADISFFPVDRFRFARQFSLSKFLSHDT